MMFYSKTVYEALGKLFQRMDTGKISEVQEAIDPIPSDKKQDNEAKAVISIDRGIAPSITKKEKPEAVESLNSVPTKGLVIKSPYIEKTLSGSKTWEMRSTLTKIRWTNDGRNGEELPRASFRSEPK